MLSIIIVNYQKPELLRLCLKSIQRAITPSFAHEVLVVDVAAGPRTRAVVVEEFPSVRYLPFAENIGYTKGVNAGIAACGSDTCFVMNSDIIPMANSFEILHKYLADHPDAGMVGPQLLNFDGTPQPSCFRYVTPLTILSRRTPLGLLPFMKKSMNDFFMNDQDLTHPTPADWLSGSAFMITMSAAKKVGPLDESMFLYLSDVDWPRRFWDNGYAVMYIPEAQMFHYHHRESRGRVGIFDVFVNRQTRQHIKDAIRYFRKYGTRRFTHVS
ncbi:MAG TPA: glycosyltransferase family 2 protein [Candidatus Paceibacterota bacterium]|nr:glycosyltransferase family 2 protein [Candidatus Paceibacterota bacterium]